MSDDFDGLQEKIIKYFYFSCGIILKNRERKMKNKEIEKQNFILWYSLYATVKELEIARTNNRETLDRLLKEYAEEVDRIDNARRLYDRVVQFGGMRTQGFDATLEIDRVLHQDKNKILEKIQ